MRSWKKALTFTLALLMLISCGVSALAADPTTFPSVAPTDASGTVDGEGKITASSSFYGKIVVTTLTVSIPTTVAFEIDPSKTAGDAEVQKQLERPTMYIINKSVVPIDVTITACTIADGDVKHDANTNPTLVTSNGTTGTTDLGTPKAVMFAIKEMSAAPTAFSSGNASIWLTTNPGSYRVLKANEAIKENGYIQIDLYGQTKTGWAAGDTFVVSPTFTVSTAGLTGYTLVGTDYSEGTAPSNYPPT